MFIVYCLALLLLVYVAPALALYPKLILSSRTAVAIPFISIAAIAVAQAVFAVTNTYSHQVVIGFSIGLLLTAAVRLFLMYTHRNRLVWQWPNTHRLLLLFSLFLGVCWAAQLGSTSFDTDDEIYSWNMWAIQHYQNVPVDFYYTVVPYPQLFSILISYCYKLLGSVELQLPAKAMFALFPVAMWGAIAVAPREPSVTNALRSVITMLLLFVAVGNSFGFGLADPLMASSLIVGIFLFMQYKDNQEQHVLLIGSVVCAAVAFYSKQPGLLWALFSLPAIALISTVKRQLPPAVLLGSGVLLVLGLIWIFGVGSGFQHNQGVINASHQGRNTIEQLLFAAKFYATDPLLSLFFAAALFAVVRTRRHLDIFILFLLPTLFAWLVYGGYNLRLGIHTIALCALLVAANNYPFPAWLGGGNLSLKGEGLLRRITPVFVVISAILASVAAFNQVKNNLAQYGNQFSPYIAGKNTIAKYFGRDTDFVFKELYDKPDLLLWIPTNYLYGVFYGHTPMMRPGLNRTPNYNLLSLIDEIRERHPNYLFEAHPLYDRTPKSALLGDLAEHQCSYLFDRVTGYGYEVYYVIYRLRYDAALIEQCRNDVQIQLNFSQ